MTRGKKLSPLKNTVSTPPRAFAPNTQPESASDGVISSHGYSSWWSLTDICNEKPLNGLMEKRGGGLIDTDQEKLTDRMQKYYDLDLAWADFAALKTGLEVSRNRFSPESARQIAQAEGYSATRLLHYAFKPMDDRWCYYTSSRPIWNDPRPQLEEWRRVGNEFLVARARRLRGKGGVPTYYTRHIGDSDLLLGYAYFFPFFIGKPTGLGLRPNLSRQMERYLAKLGFKEPATNCELASMVWHHVLAITYSPAYLAENAIDYKNEYARIPFPHHNARVGMTIDGARSRLLASAALGKTIIRLLDSESLIEGVTTGDLCTEFLYMAKLERVRQDRDGWNECDDIPLKGWGVRNERGAVLPGFGTHIKRCYNHFERTSIESGALAQGVHAGAAYSSLGRETYDIYLNGDWWWRNVPSRVWEYTIGGYPVLRKWLSYRDVSITNRGLSPAEREYFAGMVRRLAALCLLESHLNQSYAVIRDCSTRCESGQK